MTLTSEEVAGIAAYARIALTPEELTEMTTYLNETLDLLKSLFDVDVDQVEPTFRPIGTVANVVRDDRFGISDRTLSIDATMRNAGRYRDRCFCVPSILGDDGGDR